MDAGGMNCMCCGSAAVTEREVTARGYRRFRCRDCGRQFNARSGGVLNRACLPSDIIAFVVFCRLRYRLTLRDLSEIMALRGIEVSHEAVRDWETKLLPVMGDALRKRRHSTRRGLGTSWYVDETYLKVRGRWCYLYRAVVLSAFAPVLPSLVVPARSSCILHDIERNAGTCSEAGAAKGSGDGLVVTTAWTKKIAEFAMLATEAAGGVVALEASHTSDPALDAAVVLFQTIVQVGAGPVPDRPAQHREDRSGIGAMSVRRHPIRPKAHGRPGGAKEGFAAFMSRCSRSIASIRFPSRSTHRFR